LQELTLKHLPAFSAAEALIGATANMAAAAAARAIPVVFLAVFIKLSSGLNVGCTGFFPHYASLEEPIFDKVQKIWRFFEKKLLLNAYRNAY
jgi:hypothetical protein